MTSLASIGRPWKTGCLNANRNNSRADEVIANGVTIAGSATLSVDGKSVDD
jgi:hypothetical protein